MTAVDELIKANKRYAASFRHGGLPAMPRRRVAIVSCMDARLLPARFFGFGEGDAHVIRNAGGSAREALRSLVISQRMLGTKEVAVVKHTDCGMSTVTNEELGAKVREELGADASAIDFLPFSSLEDAVREDVLFLRRSPLIPEEVPIRGFVYDIRSGRVAEIE